MKETPLEWKKFNSMSSKNDSVHKRIKHKIGSFSERTNSNPRTMEPVRTTTTHKKWGNTARDRKSEKYVNNWDREAYAETEAEEYYKRMSQ